MVVIGSDMNNGPGEDLKVGGGVGQDFSVELISEQGSMESQ